MNVQNSGVSVVLALVVSQMPSWRRVTPDATGIRVNLGQSSFNSWQVFVWIGDSTHGKLQTYRIGNVEWKIDPVRIGQESSSHIGMLVIGITGNTGKSKSPDHIMRYANLAKK